MWGVGCALETARIHSRLGVDVKDGFGSPLTERRHTRLDEDTALFFCDPTCGWQQREATCVVLTTQ
jgi:hypothetical protein